MELKSFRELLLKKATDNPTLQTIIDVMRDDLIADKVIESLEKMARPQASMGRSANAAVTAFGNQMKNKDVEMMRDALSHHVSHYKSALKNGQRDIADKHLNKLIPLMHLAGKAAAHSNGQLGLDYVPLEPWETNYTTPERIKEGAERGVPGKLKEGTKGLRRRPNPGAREDNPRAVRDYRYLEMKPHEEHADVKRSPHKGGYPWEEVQLGNPAKIDAKEAYLHLQDVGKQDAYVPHPFDEHPIHQIADEAQGDIDEKQLSDIAQKMQDWHNSEHNAKWMQNIKNAHAADPEAFKARGKVKPNHFHEGLNLLKQPHKTLPDALEAKYGEQAATPATPVAQQTQVPVTPAAVAAKPNGSKVDFGALPPELVAKFGGKK